MELEIGPDGRIGDRLHATVDKTGGRCLDDALLGVWTQRNRLPRLAGEAGSRTVD